MLKNFTILGAGAIGSILGAHLARAGHSVTIIARGMRARQVARDGLRIRGLAEFSASVRVVENTAELGNAGVFIVATKTRGTAATLATLAHVDLDAAFSIQNGIRKNDVLVNAFGQGRTLGALADLSGELLPIGDVLFTRNVNLMIGELAGGISDRASKIAATIDAAGVVSGAVANIVSLEWSKFVAWAGLMMLAVTTRAQTWTLLGDSDAAVLLIRTIREMGALAQAAGVAITDRSIVPAASILRSSEADGVALVRNMSIVYREKAPDHRMSALQDLQANRALEVNETVGDALRMADSLGIAMPLTENLYRLTAAIDRIEQMPKS
jgi:2-dehydropantoate 2-reductase